MKIREVALTESIALISDQDWQKLLSILPGRLKDTLGISANRSYSAGSVSGLLRNIELQYSSSKWQDLTQQIVPLLMPYVLREIDIDLTKQQSYQGLNLSNARLILREFKQYIPELKNLLEKHRSMIVEKLLEFAENNPNMLTLDLSIINQAGLDWPELKTAVYPAYEQYLLNKFDKSYNVKTLYRLLRELKEHRHSVKDFPRLLRVADGFKEQLLFHNDTEISDMIWATLASYMTNVDRFKSMGLPWPELDKPDAYARSVLDSRKQDTVKRLLQDLKSAAPEYLLKDIAALRTVGVDWPELDIIERSLKTDVANKRQINEAQTAPFDAALADQVESLLPKPLRNKFQSLRSFYYSSYFVDFIFAVANAKFSETKKLKALDLLEPYVMKSLEARVADLENPKFSFVYFMDMLKRLRKLDSLVHYDYTDVIARNKSMLIKSILSAYREYEKRPENIGKFTQYQNFIDFSKLLDELGLNWPEMTAIVRSLASNRYVNVLNRTSMPQSKILDFVRELKRDGMTVDQLTQSAQDLVEQMKDRFIEWHTFSFKWRTSIRFELDRTMFDYFKNLKSIGLDWPEIDQYINANAAERAEMQKRNIVTAMITALKENEWGAVPDGLKELRQLGVDWPELDIIERSVNSLSNRKINEDDAVLTNLINRHHTASIASHLANGEPLQALRYMGERDITVNQLDSDLRAELELQKADAVRTMLKLFKLNIQRFGRFLEYVNKTGLDWPELSVLNRSLDAEYQKNQEEFDRHRNY